MAEDNSLDYEDVQVLKVIGEQIDALGLKSAAGKLTLDDVKQLIILHETKDKILNKRQQHLINIVDDRPAKDLTPEQLLEAIDKLKSPTLTLIKNEDSE